MLLQNLFFFNKINKGYLCYINFEFFSVHYSIFFRDDKNTLICCSSNVFSKKTCFVLIIYVYVENI